MNYSSAFFPSPLYSHAENYRRYLDSSQWQEIKRTYWFSDRPKECWACGKRWHFGSPGFNFHHINYTNLYQEKLDDLVLLCATHHEEFEQSKVRPTSNATLEVQTFAFICSHRISKGLSLKPVIKFMKGLID